MSPDVAAHLVYLTYRRGRNKSLAKFCSAAAFEVIGERWWGPPLDSHDVYEEFCANLIEGTTEIAARVPIWCEFDVTCDKVTLSEKWHRNIWRIFVICEKYTFFSWITNYWRLHNPLYLNTKYIKNYHKRTPLWNLFLTKVTSKRNFIIRFDSLQYLAPSKCLLTAPDYSIRSRVAHGGSELRRFCKEILLEKINVYLKGLRIHQNCIGAVFTLRNTWWSILVVARKTNI